MLYNVIHAKGETTILQNKNAAAMMIVLCVLISLFTGCGKKLPTDSNYSEVISDADNRTKDSTSIIGETNTMPGSDVSGTDGSSTGGIKPPVSTNPSVSSTSVSPTTSAQKPAANITTTSKKTTTSTKKGTSKTTTKPPVTTANTIPWSDKKFVDDSYYDKKFNLSPWVGFNGSYQAKNPDWFTGLSKEQIFDIVTKSFVWQNTWTGEKYYGISNVKFGYNIGNSQFGGLRLISCAHAHEGIIVQSQNSFSGTMFDRHYGEPTFTIFLRYTDTDGKIKGMGVGSFTIKLPPPITEEDWGDHWYV